MIQCKLPELLLCEVTLPLLLSVPLVDTLTPPRLAARLRAFFGCHSILCSKVSDGETICGLDGVVGVEDFSRSLTMDQYIGQIWHSHS